MSSRLIKQCLGEQLESLDLLLLTTVPADKMIEALHTAYPFCSGTPVIHSVGESDNFEFLGKRRWPLVVVLKPDIRKPSLIRLLARLRDLHADRVLHLQFVVTDSAEDSDQTWRLADSLSLGFSQQGLVDDPWPNSKLHNSQQLDVFEFNIRTYKPAPDWLNSKHWAHPERWGQDSW